MLGNELQKTSQIIPVWLLFTFSLILCCFGSQREEKPVVTGVGEENGSTAG